MMIMLGIQKKCFKKTAEQTTEYTSEQNSLAFDYGDTCHEVQDISRLRLSKTKA